MELILSRVSGRYANAYDPGYVNKSGKKHLLLTGIGPVVPIR
jgi:hypothetical protein